VSKKTETGVESYAREVIKKQLGNVREWVNLPERIDLGRVDVRESDDEYSLAPSADRKLRQLNNTSDTLVVGALAMEAIPTRELADRIYSSMQEKVKNIALGGTKVEIPESARNVIQFALDEFKLKYSPEKLRAAVDGVKRTTESPANRFRAAENEMIPLYNQMMQDLEDIPVRALQSYRVQTAVGQPAEAAVLAPQQAEIERQLDLARKNLAWVQKQRYPAEDELAREEDISLARSKVADLNKQLLDVRTTIAKAQTPGTGSVLFAKTASTTAADILFGVKAIGMKRTREESRMRVGMQ
jgi:hypothetical protein